MPAPVPAFAGVWRFGDGGIGRMLVAGQAMPSFRPPFGIWPPARLWSDRAPMGESANGRATEALAWGCSA